MQNANIDSVKRLAAVSYTRNNGNDENIAVYISCDGKRHTVNIVREVVVPPKTFEEAKELANKPLSRQTTEICALQITECDGHTCRRDRDWW